MGKKAYLLAGAVAVGLATEAYAQQNEGASSAGVEEIVVTAQRRAEALQDVPLAISAVSGSEIEDRGINDMRDVLALTPGTAFTSYNAAEPILSIRGIASGGEGAASDSGVLMMIDGEVISRDFMRSAPIFDVSRVEVLRGPQGTTYGRNASGGVLHVISRRPGDRAGGDVSLDAGSYGTVKFNAGVDLPLGPSTLSRFAFQYSRRDGYFKDVATGKRLDGQLSLAGRLTLEQKLGDNVTTTLRVVGSSERHDDTAPLKAYDPTLPVLGPPFSDSVTEPTTDPYKVMTTPGGSFFNRDIWGVSNELVIDLSWSKLTSLTSYRDGDNHFFQSSPLAYNNLNVRNNARVFTQELRLEGNAANDSIYWVVGGFFLDEKMDYGFDRFGAAATNFGPTTQRLRQTSKSKGYGIFGEVSWDLTPQLTLTVGGRYSRDEKDFELDSRAEGPFAEFFVEDPQPLIVAVSDSWGKPTGRASLQFRPSEAFMIYGTVSQGYKSGGFNSEPTNLVAATTPFEEETVLNFEAGVRTKLLDNRIHLNVTAFDMQYKDIQVSAFNSNSVEITSNAANATIRGVELEAIARPTRKLTLSVGASVYDGKFDKYVDLDGNDLAGTRLAKMPKWTFAMSAVADSPQIAGSGVLRLRADYSTRSNIANDAPADLEFGIRKGKDMVDLRLAWVPDSGKWEAALFVRNLLDKAEMNYVFPQGILEQRFVSYGPPRTWGGNISFKF